VLIAASTIWRCPLPACAAGFVRTDLRGMRYLPLLHRASLIRDTSVNYSATFARHAKAELVRGRVLGIAPAEARTNSPRPTARRCRACRAGRKRWGDRTRPARSRSGRRGNPEVPRTGGCPAAAAPRHGVLVPTGIEKELPSRLHARVSKLSSAQPTLGF
jgi:hypothetical protein